MTKKQKSPKPQYIIVFSDALKLSDSLEKQISKKTEQTIPDGVIKIIIAKINGKSSLKQWENDCLSLNVSQFIESDEPVYFRSKFWDFTNNDLMSNILLQITQDSILGFEITEVDTNGYVYYSFLADVQKAPDRYPPGFVVSDLSEFCKKLKKALLDENIDLPHLTLMNMIAKSQGYQNFQSFKDYYDSKISIESLPSEIPEDLRFKGIFNSCKTLIECKEALLGQLDFIARMRANGFEINQFDEDFYEIKASKI